MNFVYRNNVFETNSSSTHHMVIGMEDDFKKWERGETFWYRSYSHPAGFYTKEEALSMIKAEPYYRHYDFDTMPEEELSEWLDDYGFVSYDRFSDNEYLETDYNTFTTPKGETICMICEYGYDG